MLDSTFLLLNFLSSIGNTHFEGSLQLHIAPGTFLKLQLVVDFASMKHVTKKRFVVYQKKTQKF